MNVKVSDCREFETEGLYVLREFKRPVVSSNINLAVPTPDYENEFGEVFKNSSPYHQNVSVRMGNVIYPCPIEILRNNSVKLQENAATEVPFERALSRSSIHYVLKFKIGELEVAPSREQLSLTKESEKNLVNKIRKFIQEVYAETQEAFRKPRYIKDWLEIRSKYSSLLNVDLPNFKFWQEGGGIKLHGHADYTNFVRSRLNDLSNSYDFSNFMKQLDNQYPRYVMKTKRQTIASVKYQKMGGQKLFWKRPIENQSGSQYLDSGVKVNPVPIIILHSGRREPLDSESVAFNYFVRKKGKEGVTVYSLRLPIKDDPVFLRAVLRFLGHPPVVMKFSDITYVPTEDEMKAIGMPSRFYETSAAVDNTSATKTAKQKREYIYGYPEMRWSTFNFSRADTVDNPVNISGVNTLTTVYYVNPDEYSIWYNNLNGAQRSLFRYIGEHIKDNFKNFAPNCSFVWLCKAHVDMIMADKKFVKFYELIKLALTDMINSIQYPAGNISTTDHLKGVGFDKYNLEWRFHKWFTTMSNAPFKKYLELSNDITRTRYNSPLHDPSNQKYILDYAKDFGVPVDPKIVDKWAKKWDTNSKYIQEFQDKYPMMKCGDISVTEDNIKMLTKYVETVNLLTPKQLKQL
jgi:hypothetical protein